MQQVVKTFSWYVLSVVLVVSTGIGILISFRLDVEKEDASTECYNAAVLTAKMIQLNYIEDFRKVATNETTMSDASYQRIYGMISALHRSMPDIKFLYTFEFADNGKTIVYLVDAEPMDSPELSVLGEKDPADYPSFKEYYKRSDLPYRAHNLEKDPKWGTFISGYSPIVDSTGAVLGHVAADMAEETINRRFYTIILTYGSLGVILGTLIVFFAWVVILRYNRRRALEMTACAQRVKQNMEMLRSALESDEFFKAPEKSILDDLESDKRIAGIMNSNDISE